MFRRRLQLALGSLAIAALLQGGVSWWAIQAAGEQVVRGRVAADIQNGFMALLATKQRLRVWAAEATLEGQGNPARKQQLLAQMDAHLAELKALTDQADAWLGQDPLLATEQQSRRQALSVLASNLAELRRAMDRSDDATPANRSEAWQRLNQAFDMSQGQDLRTLLADSLQRERNTAQREREAANRSLQLVQRFALGATVTLALAAVLASIGFSRRLRRPLEALKAGAQALQGGDLTHRVPYEAPDEFGEVARTINGMATELERHRTREAHARHELEAQVRARTTELQEALTALRHADERRRQLLADVSHELRTPTTAIRGEAEIALRGAPKTPDDYQNTLTQIADAARHLGTVIDDLLTLARVETDALPLKRQVLWPDDPLDEACEQARSAAQSRQVRIERQPHQPLEDADPDHMAKVQVQTQIQGQVWGDAARLRQVFGILLDNAVQYSRPQTVIEVTSAVQLLDDGRTAWELCVRDQGMGIAAHELPRVMERHFRGQQAQQLAPEGLGLGLSLAQGIVRAHGGWMDLDSTPGEGTEVRVVLPCIKEQD